MISTDTLRIVDISAHLIAFYDGRIAGRRAYGDQPNWIDEGGYALGICSYAVHDGHDAIVYDTHLSIAHARRIREHLTERGITRMRVLLSHWHLDHIAGNAVFADCEIIALDTTIALLEHNRAAIETGSLDGLPTIEPLVMPTASFSGDTIFQVGAIEVFARPLDIHSRDGVSLFLPYDGTLLVGDTLEDTVTYVDEPARLADHVIDLDRMSKWTYSRLLPNHGSYDKITAGGYDGSLIEASKTYIGRLLELSSRPELIKQSLAEFIAPELADGSLTYFAPYETIHKLNVTKVLSVAG